MIEQARVRHRMPTEACDISGCYEVATIHARLVDGLERRPCAVHWTELRAAATVPAQVVAVLDRPVCFRIGCTGGAVSVMSALDGASLAVCETHLEDLSWVTPTAEELTALRNDS
jgi:hypothetical protein